MKAMAFALLGLLLLIPVPSAALSTDASSLQQEQGPSAASMPKVIQMLQDMASKCKQEKNDEEVAFAKFGTFCKMETANLKSGIEKAAEAIELLGAEITKLTSDAKTLGEEIADLDAAVASDEAQQKEQTAQREKDHEDFLAEQADYGESADALTRAIMVLQKQDYDRPAAAAALIQLSDQVLLPQKAASIVAAFVSMLDQDAQDPLGGMSYSAPEANAYEFQSGGILELLKKLLTEFNEKKGQCEKEEMNARHAYDMIMQDLTDSIANAKKEIEEKTATKASKQEKAAMDKKDLAATTESKAEDEKTLSDLEVECEEKKLSFEEKQKLRVGEIAAIQKAIEILQSPDAAGNAEKYFNLAQSNAAAASLVQMKGSNSAAGRAEGVQHKVRKFLEHEAQRLHSKSLGLLAMKVGADPFAKVKKLIDDMITRLLEEANADAKKEGYCDTEIGKSKVTRAKLSEDIDGLTAAIESGKSTIMHLTEEIATLSKEVEDLNAAMKEATELRLAEKAKNEETVEDAVAGQKAVAAATAVLEDFYKKAAQATALVQTGSRQPVKMGSDDWDALANPNYDGPAIDKGHKAGMQTFGEKYTGQQDAAGGVLALLEVVLSDFATLESDTKAAEAEGQKMYEDFMTQSKKDVAVKTKKIEMDTADKTDAEAKLQEDVADLKRTQDELLAADRAYAIIEDECVDKGMTWEERVAARQSEIDSLKQALKILSNPDIETSA